MSNAGFNVIRCPACSTCHGRRGVSATCLNDKVPISDFNDEVPSRTMGAWVQDSKNDEGIITVASVQHTLNKNHSNLDANEVLEQAEVQGMLVRLAEGRWMLLE